jgi:phenylalanyl-tRNA synthetase beta chain
MPCLSVSKLDLFALIGESYDEVSFEKEIFNFGIELDDVYEEDGKTMYKFDIPANRYDLLCIEGLALALISYIHKKQYPSLNVLPPKISVIKNRTLERPAIACAIIRNICFTNDKYDSFISYQDKLHCSIGRNRSIVAIGTHDYNKMDNGQISYGSVNLNEISFCPLNNNKIIASRIINGSELEQYFSNDKKISKFFGLLENPNKSVAFKCNDTIISIPPIINSDNTKISKETTDIFVEVTGSDFNRVNTALKLILYNFRGQSVESVIIKDASSQIESFATPLFHDRKYQLSVDHINNKLNLNLTPSEIKDHLERMIYKVKVNGNYIDITTIDVRSDIMHECDIIEDIAISYGFNNFVKNIPAISSIGSEDALNKFTDKIRNEMALAGFNEVLTLTLLSKTENFIDSELAVELLNPKSKEYHVARTSLIPGILKSIASNLHGKIPIKMFESSDVVILSNEADENAKNLRKLAAVICGNKSQLEDLQGPLSLMFEKCGLYNYSYALLSESRYLENQAATVLLDGEIVGTIGVLHPSVCVDFKIPYAASAFEIDLEKVFEHFNNKA